MALVNPQVIAIARLFIDSGVKSGDRMSYVFSNGFETGRVPGAAIGSGPIFQRSGVNPSPQYVLFLNDPVDAGSLGTQGGIKVRADVVGVSTLDVPSPNLPGDAEIRIQYSDFNLFGTSYQNVDPRKAIGLSLYLNTPEGFEPYNGDLTFDIVVTSDPVVTFVGKPSVVK